MNWGSSTDVYTLPCITWTASGQLYSTRRALTYGRAEWEGGREAPEGGDIGTLTAESRCCTAETSTTL